MQVEADQRNLLCPNCGGQRVFAPRAGALQCESCGQVQDLGEADDARAAQEFAFDPDTPRTEATVTHETHVHHCETCGGDVVFTGKALSDRCPYCNGPVVLGPRDESYETTALIPFGVERDEAVKHAQKWAANRLAAPGDLLDSVKGARTAGLYAPFWTFDSREAVHYWAKYTTGSGKNRRTRSTSGKMNIFFDDLLAPASPHVTPLIRDGILHEFRPESLRPYRAGYLAGFAAERHHQSVAEGLQSNEADKRLLIRNRIKRHINKSRITSLNYRTDTSGIHYRRILLPVWMFHYEYGGTAKKIVVSGIDGRTFGERPFSTWKLAGYSALISALAIVTGLVWGAFAAM